MSGTAERADDHDSQIFREFSNLRFNSRQQFRRSRATTGILDSRSNVIRRVINSLDDDIADTCTRGD
jgi:hypothetical protein